MMGFCVEESTMNVVPFAGPGRLVACVLLAAVALSALPGCRDRHEPVKPTVGGVAAARPQNA